MLDKFLKTLIVRTSASDLARLLQRSGEGKQKDRKMQGEVERN